MMPATKGESRITGKLSGARTEIPTNKGSLSFYVQMEEEFRMGEELKRTPLFSLYQEYGGKTIDFGGWELPVQF